MSTIKSSHSHCFIFYSQQYIIVGDTGMSWLLFISWSASLRKKVWPSHSTFVICFYCIGVGKVWRILESIGCFAEPTVMSVEVSLAYRWPFFFFPTDIFLCLSFSHVYFCNSLITASTLNMNWPSASNSVHGSSTWTENRSSYRYGIQLDKRTFVVLRGVTIEELLVHWLCTTSHEENRSIISQLGLKMSAKTQIPILPSCSLAISVIWEESNARFPRKKARNLLETMASASFWKHQQSLPRMSKKPSYRLLEMYTTRLIMAYLMLQTILVSSWLLNRARCLMTLRVVDAADRLSFVSSLVNLYCSFLTLAISSIAFYSRVLFPLCFLWKTFLFFQGGTARALIYR